MRHIDNRIIRQIDVLQVFEFFEDGWQDVKIFILCLRLAYIKVQTCKLVAGVIEDHFEIMQVFIDEIVKVYFLFGLFLFFTFLLHLKGKI